MKREVAETMEILRIKYADTAINIYYLVIAIYGWFSWRYGNKEKQELQITHITLRQGVAMVALYAVMQVAVWLALKHFTDSDVAWFNALTSALSIVGMWMLARKYVEQWLVWIVVDALSAGLYVYKELYFTAGLYALYTVIAYFGYKEWIRLMKE